jgi:hypothetical protein
MAEESLFLYELKHCKPWFVEECLHFLDKRKHAKIQWLKDPSQSSADYLNNVRCVAFGRFRNKMK